MAIELRAINPPIVVPERGPSRADIERYARENPRGRVLPAGRYTIPLPGSHEIATLSVLKTGRGVYRTHPEGVDLEDPNIRRSPDPLSIVHIGEKGQKEPILDRLIGTRGTRRGYRVINHLLVYNDGNSPTLVGGRLNWENIVPPPLM